MQLFWYQLSLLEPCHHLKMADEGAANALVTTLKDLTMAGACNMLSWTVDVHHPRLVDVEYQYQGRTIRYQKLLGFQQNC